MTWQAVVSVLLVILAALDWLFTQLLIRGARAINEPALSERALVSVMLSALATGIGVIALAFLLNSRLPVPVGTVIIVGVFVGVSAPQIIWGLLYLRGKFR